jgi:uncharacterized protein involved in exopolysaccharide biosynthesis
MSEQAFDTISEDEISLKDIIRFLVESWKTIVLGGTAGGLLGLGYAVIAPNQYQVTASIQMAKVAGVDVENPLILFEKLKMPTYYSQKTYANCNVLEKQEPGEAIIKTLKLTLVKSTSIITISNRDSSSENAKKCLEAVLSDIRDQQSLLAKPIFDIKASQLASLKLKYESAENFIKKLPNKNYSFDFSDSKFSASALLLATTLSKEIEIKDLRSQVNELEITLNEPQTKETSLVTPMYEPQEKVSPSTVIVLAVGLFGGLVLGLILAIGQRSYRVSTTSNHN